MTLRRSQLERRVLDAIDFARRIAPGYARGVNPTPAQEIETLTRYLNVRVRVTDLDHPSILLPPIAGSYRLLMDEGLHWGTRDFVIRHELGHILAGDCEEPTLFHFAGPLPEAEEVADLFAFADFISDEDCRQGKAWVATRMRRFVVVDYAPFFKRIPRLAPKVIRMRELIDHYLEG